METTYTALRAELATFLDKVADDREPLIVRRRGANRDVAIIAADELSSLIETAYLMRSPKNAERLLESLAESRENDRKGFKGRPADEALAELRKALDHKTQGPARK